MQTLKYYQSMKTLISKGLPLFFVSQAVTKGMEVSPKVLLLFCVSKPIEKKKKRKKKTLLTHCSVLSPMVAHHLFALFPVPVAHRQRI